MGRLRLRRISVQSKQLRQLIVAIGVAAIVVGAAWLRFSELGARPMHGDEANQAVKTGALYDQGEYRYDPFEHHGPTLYYFALPVLRLTGAASYEKAQARQYRLVPAVFGFGLVLLTLGLWRLLGPWPAFWAGAFTAISHVMVYYSRYYIQEMLFTFFALCFIVCAWKILQGRGTWWAVLGGIAAGLLHATKETGIFVFAAGILAYVVVVFVSRDAEQRERGWKPRPLVVFVACGLLVSVAFFSSFFTWWRGPLDSLLTYWHYVRRAEGQGSSGLHDKPFYYYFTLLSYTYRMVGPRWTEAPVLLLALVGAFLAWRPCKRLTTEEAQPSPHLFARFVSVYAWSLALLLSALPYKTPWNLLVFYQPMLLLAGLGLHGIIKCMHKRWLRLVAITLTLGVLYVMARQTRLGTTVYAADVRNPYVYAHTSTDLVHLVERVETIRAIAPADALQINIIKPDGDYWPLPWYLRSFHRVGYWPAIPEKPDAPLLIAPPELAEALSAALRDKYFVEMYSL
ncbi:MAG: TIGR03663 family protein, partial [Candidatus Hydrogenedentes bacterium]|nr:TIGR03663 family protein [Candidatus Hydrogenedentota bacterium]